MLRAVSIIVAPALHTIFVTVRSRLSTYLTPLSAAPVPPSLSCSIFPPCLRPSPDFFSRERRFFSALLPEPQNGAKMRYRFAEPGLAADRSADFVRRFHTPRSPAPPLFRSIDKHHPASALFFPFQSFALEMSGEF